MKNNTLENVGRKYITYVYVVYMVNQYYAIRYCMQLYIT